MKSSSKHARRDRPPSAPRRRVKDLHALSYQILQSANRGLGRVDFQREVSKMLLELSGCDSIEFWLYDHDKYYRCEARKDENQSPKTEFLPPMQSSPSPLQAGNKSHVCDSPTDRAYRSHTLIPLVVGDRNVGVLQLRSREKDYFKKDEMQFYESLAESLGMAVAYRHVQVDLRERVKELTCLYGIARLVAQPEVSLREILQAIVELLPPAWLYPEIASSRIILGGNAYQTSNFKEDRHRQTADILIDGEKRGVVEVVYAEEKPDLDEGPFMKEERSLIDTVAKELAIIIKRRETEDEKLRLQDQLRHADRLATIGQLAAGVAHELNEPLGNILGFAQLVKKSPGLPLQVEQDVEKIFAASLYSREVVKKLLLFARQVMPQKAKVNLNQIVKGGLFFFESRCAKERIELVRRLTPNLPAVTADSAQLNQVLINLVVNAIQAMPNGGKLTVQTSVEGEEVLLTVEDTGIGMNKEVLKKIFIPFFTTKEVGQGTGLGLPVVHGIITSHGGSIRVESNVGQGTRFEIRLPVGEREESRNHHEDGLA